MRIRPFPFKALLALVFVVGLFLWLLTRYGDVFPPPWPDEILFIQPASEVAAGRFMATPSLRGQLPGIAQRTFWQPPLYFLILSLWGRIAGFSIAATRLFSRLAATGVLFIVYALGREWGLKREWAYLTVVLTALDTSFQVVANVGRMDIFCSFFTMAMLFLFTRYWRQNRTMRHLIGAGLFGSFAVLTHLIAAPVVIGIAYLLWRSHKRRDAILFLSPLLVGLTLWCAYGLQEPTSFWQQLALQFARKGNIASRILLLLLGRASLLPAFSINTLPLWGVWLLLGIQKRTLSLSLAWQHYLIAVAYISVLIGGEPWYVGWYLPLSYLLLTWVAQNFSFVHTRVLVRLAIGLFIIYQVVIVAQNVLVLPSLREEFTQFIDDNVRSLPPHASVTVYSIPDPSLYLIESRPDLDVRAVAPLPLPNAVFQSLLRDSDNLILMPLYADRRLFLPTVQQTWYFHGSKGTWEVVWRRK